jgi:uncharacterized protein (TIGR03067 family)
MMMKAAVLVFTAGTALLVGGQADEAALKKEQARFVGMWKVTKLTTPQGDQDISAGLTLTFGKDGSFEYRKGDETKKANFKLNPAAKLKEIDISPDDDANKVMRGIYQVEKDTLKICLDLGNSGKRPDEFAAPQSGTNILVVAEKAK